MKEDLKPNAFVTLVGEANCFAFETLVRSTGGHLSFLVLKSLSFDVQEQKSLNISEKWQFAATHLSGIFYGKIHCLTSEFHDKFHAKNRYRTNREAMSTISVFQVKFDVEFTRQAVNFS